MAWTYYTTDANSIHYSTYSDNTTMANDYFGDWIHSFTAAGTGTTYNPYSQTNPYIGTCIAPSQIQMPFMILPQEQHAQPQPLPQPPQKSPEQTKEETEAAERAKNLLLEYLDEDNKQKFLDKKHLEIASKLFKNVRYNIPLSKLGRIKAWKDDNVITELCLVVKEVEQLPTEDVVLTKLLHVMNDEANMLRTANHSNVKENLLTGLN